MEKKEIRITEDELTEAMAEATDEIVGELPTKKVGAASGIVLLIGLVNAKLVDILFGGETSTDEEGNV